ncbi:MAG: hypothetical protein RLZ72_823 [Actinomycetota bacterium]
MSAVAHSVYGSPRPQAQVRPGLRAVSRPRAQLSVRTVTIIIAAFVAIVIARLFISVAIESSQYEIASLSSQNANLGHDAQFLSEQLSVLDSPQNVAAMAIDLGMVSNSKPTYIRLSDGKVWGSGKAAADQSKSVGTVANDLIGAYGDAPSLAGVATTSVTVGATQSESQTATASTGIPAPATH